jgi:8-oxoguanine deaminase
MGTLRLHSIDVLATMTGEEIRDGAVLVRDGWIEQVGSTDEVDSRADENVDLSGHVVLPGLVNTHHHLWQTLARAVPAAQDAGLIDWLRVLLPIAARLTPDSVRVGGRLGAAELALSGCTTAVDHQYTWPGGCRIDDLVEGASSVGIRLHLSRGANSKGTSHGTLAPDVLAEGERSIMDETARAIAHFHDPEPGAMLRVVVGPAAMLAVSAGLMRELAVVARESGAGLHTHLAETVGEAERCIADTGVRPLDYLESLGWLGPDVWFAHVVHLEPAEIRLFAESGTGVAHCPTSNMRLGSGIAPLQAFLRAGIRVGLGVDGSASNDTSNLLTEARQAMLLARVALGTRYGGETPGADRDRADYLTAREALRIATVGGAQVLGRADLGTIEPGKVGDIVAVNLDRLQFSGAHDPLAALVFCGPSSVDQSWVYGRRVVKDGQLTSVDVGELAAEHRRVAQELFQ